MARAHVLRRPFGVHKFGRNFDIDTGSTPEEVWSGGGIYQFPTASEVPEIVSDDLNDTAGGSGARTVELFGLDDDYRPQQETVIMNGLTPVTLTKSYLRLFRGIVRTGGTPQESNIGNISITHPSGPNLIAHIPATYGETLMAIFTISSNFKRAELLNIFSAVERQTATAVGFAIQIREFGAVFRTIKTWALHSTGTTFFLQGWDVEQPLLPRTDIRLRVTGVTSNNADISAGFQIQLF